MSITEGDNRYMLKNVNICLILVVGSRDLLHYVLYFPEYFIFHMKCFILFFIKERKAEVARDERPSGERQQSPELHIIYYFFQQVFITDLLSDLL